MKTLVYMKNVTGHLASFNNNAKKSTKNRYNLLVNWYYSYILIVAFFVNFPVIGKTIELSKTFYLLAVAFSLSLSVALLNLFLYSFKSYILLSIALTASRTINTCSSPNCYFPLWHDTVSFIRFANSLMNVISFLNICSVSCDKVMSADPSMLVSECCFVLNCSSML